MLLRTTSRSWATGARISSVTRWLGVQYWRSPSRTFRTSLRLRLSTGVSGPTTIAISPAAPAPQAGVSDTADASSIALHRTRQRPCAEIFNTQLLLYKWGRLRGNGNSEQASNYNSLEAAQL